MSASNLSDSSSLVITLQFKRGGALGMTPTAVGHALTHTHAWVHTHACGSHTHMQKHTHTHAHTNTHTHTHTSLRHMVDT